MLKTDLLFQLTTSNMNLSLQSPVVKSFIAGSLSGTCSTIIFQPLDLLKTRLQSPLAIGQSPVGIVTVVGNVLRNEKLVGMWRGLAPSLSRTVPSIGVYFSSLHYIKSNFGSTDPAPLESLITGICARSFAGFSILPFTVVKTRFESGMFEYKSVIQALRIIYVSEGAKGLYSGMSATLLRDAPFSGLYLMFYTQAKKIAHNRHIFDGHEPIVHFSCGVMAGCLASLVTQPADVVKTQMQLYPDHFNKISVVVKYIFEREGAAGFLRGIVPRTVRRTLMAAMAWTVYEQLMCGLGLKT